MQSWTMYRTLSWHWFLNDSRKQWLQVARWFESRCNAYIYQSVHCLKLHSDTWYKTARKHRQYKAFAIEEWRQSIFLWWWWEWIHVTQWLSRTWQGTIKRPWNASSYETLWLLFRALHLQMPTRVEPLDRLHWLQTSWPLCSICWLGNSLQRPLRGKVHRKSRLICYCLQC